MKRAEIEQTIERELQRRTRSAVNRNALSALFGAFVDPVAALGRVFFGRGEVIEAQRRIVVEDNVLDLLCGIHEALSRNKLSDVERLQDQARIAVAQFDSQAPMQGTREGEDARTITFSGFDWTIKSGPARRGPGPNYFSDAATNVWLDDAGRLHLRVYENEDKWVCSEVIGKADFGYGRYLFHLGSALDDLDKNIVVGLFTWNDVTPEQDYREMDIEFARWGDRAAANGNYVVQPGGRAGNHDRFPVHLDGSHSTHIINWLPDCLTFESIHGHYRQPPSGAHVIRRWVYRGRDVPAAGTQNVRINVWLFKGMAPSDGKEAEVIITGFEFEAHHELSAH